ncbi:Telomerase reverse transcriptase [Toxocara canis]|uniref:Telomerase reverse transcriptase n=1 Tax=Toxocara canis TaxID=6265 RepID=A0A0B2UU93_TOXCA|nr:Telomerase reverse transcriptase [Toxocara canis]
MKGGLGVAAYESFFRRFRKFAKRNASRKMFVVKTDIRDCFDCINQHKLSQVLASIIDSNRSYLFTAGRFKKNKEERKNNEGKRIEGKEKRGKETSQRTNASCREMALGLPVRSISYVLFPEHCTRVQIKGNEALEILEKAVIQQKILFRNRFYVAGRGIPQGSTVSTRLCDLYLGAVERERCADILKRRDCLLFRNVDDYILLTTDVRLADRFLKDLLCGVEDGYEMVADPSKTTINFVTDLHEFKILFRNRFYVAGRGIPQGSTVSTRLCDLYLGAVERERCADILKRRACLLFRYVDDYILLTTDVRLADRFLKDLLCGVEDGYEMVADASKTTINFVTDLHEFKLCVNVIDDDGFVTWCGYRIYPRELRVRQEP